MIRVRFKANADDPRPIFWPIKHPYWVTGYDANGRFATVVAYAGNEDYIMRNWPEASDLETDIVDDYEFTSRFPKPGWWDPDQGDITGIEIPETVANITIEMDRSLHQAIVEIQHLCRPALHVFTLSYAPGPGPGWTCTIQETRLSEICTGTDRKIPRKAISAAMIRLQRRNEAEAPYDKPVFRNADIKRIMDAFDG